MQFKMNGKKVAALIIAIIAIDQLLKFYIKLNYFLGEEHQVIGSWFRLHFVENEGMGDLFKSNTTMGLSFVPL